MSQIKQGTITQWFGNRGFGFIQSANGKNFFFHISEWSDDAVVPPTLGQQVSFESVVVEKGPKAINVVPINVDAQVGADALLGGAQ